MKSKVVIFSLAIAFVLVLFACESHPQHRRHTTIVQGEFLRPMNGKGTYTYKNPNSNQWYYYSFSTGPTYPPTTWPTGGKWLTSDLPPTIDEEVGFDAPASIEEDDSSPSDAGSDGSDGGASGDSSGDGGAD